MTSVCVEETDLVAATVRDDDSAILHANHASDLVELLHLRTLSGTQAHCHRLDRTEQARTVAWP
jgi:hypothetical protein